MKNNLFLAIVCCAIVGLSGAIFAADDIQQAYNDFRQEMGPLRQQLFDKQQELRSELNRDQRDDNTVKQLFRDIADVKSQIAIAQSTLQKKADGQNPGSYGMHHSGEFDAGVMDRGMGMGGGCMMMGGGGYGHGGRGGRGGHHGW